MPLYHETNVATNFNSSTANRASRPYQYPVEESSTDLHWQQQKEPSTMVFQSTLPGSSSIKPEAFLHRHFQPQTIAVCTRFYSLLITSMPRSYPASIGHVAEPRLISWEVTVSLKTAKSMSNQWAYLPSSRPTTSCLAKSLGNICLLLESCETQVGFPQDLQDHQQLVTDPVHIWLGVHVIIFNSQTHLSSHLPRAPRDPDNTSSGHSVLDSTTAEKKNRAALQLFNTYREVWNRVTRVWWKNVTQKSIIMVERVR